MSLQQRLERRSATLKRKLFDNNIRVMGTETDVIRFKVTEDMYGDQTLESLNEDPIIIIINYPTAMPMSRLRNDPDSDLQAEDHTYFFDILPIETFAQWGDNVEKGDFLFHKIEDENLFEIPILLRVSEVLGSFNTTLLWRKLYVAPYNGQLPTSVQTLVDNL